MNRSDEDIAAWARATLERGIAQDGEATTARLRSMRLRALERARARQRWPERLVPLGAAAAALLVALTVSLNRSPPDTPEPGVFDLLAEGQDLELVEDLEFYEWLDRGGHAG